VQLTAVESLQTPAVELAEMSWIPAGSVSLTTTKSATSGPAFSTMNV
jgi:hypothetical protein